ncbi:MAG TPA: UvrB/UvrC motif-containing protein [Parachlamydiaceae bacterium]|nr:UvrB/UvrC motif-containing protein [Parachlamydiaceae bacterium]
MIPEEKIPERPLECGECKKPIAIRYTEIVKNNYIETSMCADCPELQKRLHGQNVDSLPGGQISKAGVACGNCGTTLQAVRVGASLGCSNCYEIFKDVIVQELLNLNKITLRAAAPKKNTLFHVGRQRGEMIKFNPSAQLIALNEALVETLKQEDYEQAALLRDQIKALTDKRDEGKSEEQQ